MGGTKSEHLQAVHAVGENIEVGDVRRVRVIEAKTNSLSAVAI